MKCLVVAPRTVHSVGEYYEFPLGLAYISSALKAAGFNVACLNLNHYHVSIGELISRAKADVVFTGGLCIHYREIEQVLAAAKKAEAKTVLGGGILSSNPMVVMNDLKPDFGVLFEGEKTVVELAAAIESNRNIGEVNGLAYPKNAQICFSQPRKPITDLDTIPFADYEGLEAGKYLDSQMTNDSHFLYLFDKPRMLPVISSRSCPFNCSFCFHPLGKEYRVRSLSNFFEEIEALQHHFKINIACVYDELFTMNIKRLNAFCDRMKQTGLKWIVQLRVDAKINDSLMMKLKDSGCFCLGYGLESGSDTVLKSMGKKTMVSQMENALALTQKHQIGIQGNFIFGDVAESQETIRETLDWYRQNRSYQIGLHPIYIYSGTELYKTALKRGLVKDEVSFQKTKYPIVNLSQIPDDEYAWLLRELVRLNVETRHLFAAKILAINKIEADIYDLKVECPFCHAICHYGRFNVDSSQVLDVEGCQTACRNCNQRITVFVPSLFNKVFSRLPFRVYLYASRVKRKVHQTIRKMNER